METRSDRITAWCDAAESDLAHTTSHDRSQTLILPQMLHACVGPD